MKKLILIVLVLVAIGAGAGAYYIKRGGTDPQVTTAQVSRGEVVDQVGATGTLQAVTTVQVGTQVSGTVDELYADFNSIVKKGQVIARLDPSILKTQVDTAKANLVNAQANLERQKVALEDANTKLARSRELADRSLLPKADLDTAVTTAKQAEAQLKSTESQIVQAQAAVSKAEVDLAHTIITAPIDGIVISRNVDRGQTVASSMQAPTLYVIAADLTKMQVNANIDESDVGRMRPGQTVRFRVDAYPTEQFIGTVEQVRLNPTTVQNVVTYSTVIDVPNPELKLKPGMTANVNIEIARRSNALRIPNAALRFRPTRDTFQALNQQITPDIERALGGGGGRGGGGLGGRGGQNAGGPGQNAPGGRATGGATGSAPQPSATAGQSPSSAERSAQQRAGTPASQTAQAALPRNDAGAPSGGAFQRGGGDVGGGRSNFDNMDPERRKRMEERMAQMTPEEREQFQARMRERMAQGGGFGGGRGGSGDGQGPGNGQGQGNVARGGQGNQAAPGNRGQQPATETSKLATTKASTIDSLFGPLPSVETRGRVWLYISKQLKPVNLRLGISDGTWTEVLDSNELQQGTEVVTNVVTGTESAARPGGNNNGNPLMGPQGRPGGPGGFGGGGGGGRGR
jgi:HlyD family secretion protein